MATPLDTLIEAAAELDRRWYEIGGLETGYPQCLPDFTEFLHELIQWRARAFPDQEAGK